MSFSVENNSTDFYQVIPFDYISCYYVTLSNCDYRCYGSLCQSDLNIKYTFHILNGDRNNLGYLSVDEEGLVAISAVFLYIYIIINSGLQLSLTILIVFIQHQLEKIDKYHPTVKLLKWSIIVNLISYLLYLIYYTIYSNGEKY